MSFELLFGFALANIIACLLPGPAMLLSLTHGARFGLCPALATNVGLSLMAIVYGFVAMAGLGALLAVSEAVFSAIRLAGAAYLVWLGIKLLRSGGLEALAGSCSSGKNVRIGRLFRQGVLVGAGNPKAIAFYTAVFPQFIDTGAALLPQYVSLLTILFVTTFGCLTLCTACGTRVSGMLRSSLVSKWFARVTGGLFVSAGAALALSSE